MLHFNCQNSKPTANPSPHMTRFYFIFLLFFLLVVLTHLTAFHSGFMEDDNLVLNGYSRNIKYIFHGLMLNSTGTVFRPMLYGLFSLEYFFFGDDAEGYRWVSLILYAGVGTAICFFIHRVFENKWLAYLTAFFFTIHPVNQNIVNAFSSSYIDLQVIFTLACLYWGGVKSFSFKNIVIALSYFMLALLCHETAAAIPIYLFSFCVIVQKRSWRKQQAHAPCLVFF